MITDELGNIDYDEHGSGPTIVLVPGSCSTGAAWRPVIAAWNGQFRCVTTSLLGYGGTAERRRPEDCSIVHEVEALEAVIRKAAVPVHLVGHSFGGLVAIALSLRSRALLVSLTVLEAPAVELLRHGRDDQRHYRDFLEMTDRYFAAFAGGDVAAIRQMVDFYGGPETFASWPQRVRAYAMETTAVNIRDWASAFGFALSPGLLGTINVPSVFAWGERSHPAVRRANSLLGASLKASTSVEVSGAAHFMISTHAQEVAQIISGHVLQVEEPKLRSNLRQPTVPSRVIVGRTRLR
jgi:pimeloyl-ACP methyl ester carboxylesterase